MIEKLSLISRIVERLKRFKVQESFTLKVFSIFVTIFVAIAFFSTLYFVLYQVSNEKRALESKGKTIAAFLADSVRTGLFSESKEMMNEAVTNAMGQPEVLSVSVYNADGKELIRRDRGTTKPVPDTIMEFVEPVIMEQMPNGWESMYFTSQASAEKKNIGFIKIYLDSSDMSRGTRNIAEHTLVLALIFITIGTVLLFISIRRVLRPLTILTQEVRMIGEGKEINRVSVITSDEIGRLAEAFNSMTDNLKRRDEEALNLEKQLRHSQKMDAVGTLARGIAHDFNNILTTVQASLFAMQKRISKDDTLYNYISRMDNSVTKAKSLVQGLMAFGQGRDSQSYPVDVCSVVDDMIPTIEGMIGDGISFKIVKHSNHIVVMADTVQLKQIFLNLVANARDAMPTGGSLTISMDQVDTRDDSCMAEHGKFALISVRDTGNGISEGIKDKIFDPFFTTKEVGKGTGLGLSIVYGIVERHHGHICVRSDFGSGTEFRVYLPKAELKIRAEDYAARGIDGDGFDSR